MPDFSRLLLACLLLTMVGALPAAEPPVTAEVLSVAKIWDAGTHNAFTDLVRHNDRWYCAFREATDHVSDDGAIRIIASDDGRTWFVSALLSCAEGDLRDPKICVAPDDRLMLSTVLWTPDDKETTHQSRVYFSADGKVWEGPHDIGDKNFWLWRTSWHDGQAYNIGYATRPERMVRLYRSEDGLKFTPLVENLGVKNGQPNESALGWHEDGEALCLLRCEKPAIAQLGRAKPPYKDWTWKELGQQLGGPNLIRHDSGAWLAAGRVHQPSVHTGLCWLDTETPQLVELAKLPSGGDTSYPGLVWHDGLLWMSYYSTHEGKTSIYLARIQVEKKGETPEE